MDKNLTEIVHEGRVTRRRLLFGAAGALEAVFTIQSIYHRIVPATINLDEQDPEIPLNVVTGENQKLPDGDIAALNNSFGFGGHNVALAIRSI